MPKSDSTDETVEPVPFYLVPAPIATVDEEALTEAARKEQAEADKLGDAVDRAADLSRGQIDFAQWVAALQRLAGDPETVDEAKAVVGAPEFSSRDQAGSSSDPDGTTPASAVWGPLFQAGYSPRQAVEGAKAAAALDPHSDEHPVERTTDRPGRDTAPSARKSSK